MESLRKLIIGCLLLVGWLPQSGATGQECQENLARRVETCRAIPVDESVTGLLFNPRGYQHYYLRSYCLQNLALEFREISLCQEVKRRYSLLLDGSQISEQACLEKVGEKKAQDRQEFLKAREVILDNQANLARPVAADIIPSPDQRAVRALGFVLATEGRFEHSYVIEAEATAEPLSQPIRLLTVNTYLGALRAADGTIQGDQLRFDLPLEAFETLLKLPAKINQLRVTVRVAPDLSPKACDRTDFSEYERVKSTTQREFLVQRRW